MKQLFMWALIFIGMIIVFAVSCPAQSTAASKPDSSLTVSAEKQYVQCSAITKDGDRCLRKTTNASGICTQHMNATKKDPGNVVAANASVQCSYIRSDNSRCQNMTKDKSGKCWQHR